MIRPTLRQLAYLIALEEEKSFSRAAENCHVTQSTLSAGIKELEDALGQTLVNRSSRIATLTPFGQEVSEQAKQILNDVDHIVTRAKQMQAPMSGAFRLGVIPTIAPYLLPEILPMIRRKYPDLDVQIFEDLSERIVENVHKGNLDAIILALPYDTQGLQTTDLFEEEFLLAAPKNKALPKHIALKDLKPEELLLLEDGHCLRDHALDACGLQIPQKKKTFSATSLATLIQMVGHGYGVTLLPEMVATNAPMPDSINLSHFESPVPTRKIGMAWQKNNPNSKNAAEFMEALRSFTHNPKDILQNAYI